MRPVITLVLFVCVSILGCQPSSTRLPQSVARADETAVIASLHSISQAENAYRLTSNDEYGTLEQLVNSGYLDQRFNSAQPVANYILTVQLTPRSSSSPASFYSVHADPQASGERAGRHYYIDSTSSVIHVNATQPATATDETIQ